MHKAITRSRCSAIFRAIHTEVLIFLRSQTWAVLCDSGTDNFHIRIPAELRILR